MLLSQSSSEDKLETVRVKHKGQVTIPVRLRRRFEIEEGDLLSIDAKDSQTIVMKLRRSLEPGNPVGPEQQEKILKGLEKLRKSWR